MIAPGPSEIIYGLEKVNDLAANANIPVVSANLPGVAPYVVLPKNKGEMNVLVTSVVDPALLPENSESLFGEAMDPVSALRHIQQQASHDLFVVIIHGGREMVASVVDQCPGIDLVISGESSELIPERPPDDCPPVVANNKEGTYVAYIDYIGNHKNAPDFSDPVQIRTAVGEVAEDPQISALVQGYNLKRQEILRQQSEAVREKTRGRELPAHYVGNQSCQLCHAEINDRWANSRHAEAMGSLLATSRHNDPDCLSCHVTGVKKKPATEISWIKEDHPMAGVQCEACHGPGAEHSRDPVCSEMLTVNAGTCTQCHTEFKDPKFDYNQDLEKINHGQMESQLKRDPEERQRECGRL